MTDPPDDEGLAPDPSTWASPDGSVPTSDFDDIDAHNTRRAWPTSFDAPAFKHPIVLRSLLGVTVAIAILAWPNRTDEVLARLVGVGLVLLGSVTAWASLRNRPIEIVRAIVAALVAILGTSLLGAPPSEADDLLGQAIGVLALLLAARLVADVARNRRPDQGWQLAQAGLLLSVGLLLLRFPETLLHAAIALLGIGWLALSLIAIARTVDPNVEGVSSYTDATSLVADWLVDRPKRVDDRRALYAKILFDGPTASRSIGRFFTLMCFASVIAAAGVIGDSTAVVIGAMLIAPLMTPLMGMAISLVMGWPNRLIRSTLVAGGGIVVAIVIGLLVGFFSPVAFDTATNAQIVARTSPTTLDLLVAVAAGAAGAYGLSRPDVSDSLPGVAIAISLVPPLSVAGISISQGDWSSGNGALLLFATNALAILVIGGVTFVITGVTPVERLANNQQRTRTSLVAVAGICTFVIGALLLNGAEIAQNLAIRDEVDDAVAAWLDPFVAHDAVEVTIDGDIVTAVIIGPAAGAPAAETLANSLTADLDREITVVVRMVVEERDTATGITRP